MTTPEEEREYERLRRLAFPELIRCRYRGWHAANRQRINKAHYAWRKRNPENVRISQNKSRKKRAASDPIFRLLLRVRGRINTALRDCGKYKLGRSISLLGCSARQYKDYLEALFLPGMSWANRSLWHIDHKKPLASFDLSTETGQCAAFHYSNTQPLWAIDNLRKGARVV